ncbi:MAG: hypothetical protein GXO82_07895 [Chlorobi bacterium]|nr:hypothetical protein [Chlorobiota bacterium]
MRRGLLLLVVLGWTAPTYAQINYSFNNYLRYGKGTKNRGGVAYNAEYLENMANARLFMDKFTMGVRFLYDAPHEYGPHFLGIQKRYVEFEDAGLQLRAGTYWTLFGKGLAMNLFENRGIYFDTGLDGLRATYRSDMLDVILAAGNLAYRDMIDTSRIENYIVRGGTFAVRPLEEIEIGGSFVDADGAFPPASFSSGGVGPKVKAEIPEINLALHAFGFDLFASYARKKATIQETGSGPDYDMVTRTSYGEGIYGSLAFASEDGWGFTFEYKDYRFDVVDPFTRVNINRPTRALPFQNPPIVFKEHAFTLLSRDPHQIDFSDEIGMQIEVFYALTSQIVLNFNASAASRHKSYEMVNGNLRTIERDNKLLPSLSKEFSPFYEVYGELEWYFTDVSFLRAAFNRRFDAPYEELGGMTHEKSSTTLPVKIEYELGDGYFLEGEVETQFFHDSFLVHTPDYTNLFLMVVLSRSPDWSVALRTEFSSIDERDEPSGRSFWAFGEVTYRLTSTHTISIGCGTERGGVICSSGICRQVDPFSGVRFSVLTQW